MTNTPSTAAAALGTEFGVAGPAATDEHSQTQPYTRHAARQISERLRDSSMHFQATVERWKSLASPGKSSP